MLNAKAHFLLSRTFLAKLINHSSIQALCIPFCQTENTERFLLPSERSSHHTEESITASLIYLSVSDLSSRTTANELAT